MVRLVSCLCLVVISVGGCQVAAGAQLRVSQEILQVLPCNIVGNVTPCIDLSRNSGFPGRLVSRLHSLREGSGENSRKALKRTSGEGARGQSVIGMLGAYRHGASLLLFGLVLLSCAACSSRLAVSVCSPHQLSPSLPCLHSDSLAACSGREVKEGCVLVLSLPPEVKREALSGPSAAAHQSDLTNLQVWMLSCLSVGLISLSGVTGAVLWPLIDSPLYSHLMTSLIGLAVGSLTATSLFQLLPEAFDLKNLSGSDDYLNTALFIWFSLWAVFVLEGFSKIVFRRSHKEPVTLEKVPNGLEETMQLKDIEEHHGHDQIVKPGKKVGAVAWMIIFGDGLHNFIDGMSIGAGFSQSFATGIGLSIAIACEEFPHELGDFAILLQSGLSLKKALCYNFLSACTAFGGLVLGILLGQLEGAHFVFAFAGGLFLYISLTHLIPELKGEIKVRLKKSKTEAIAFFLLQNLGVLLGTAVIYAITKNSDAIANAV